MISFPTSGVFAPAEDVTSAATVNLTTVPGRVANLVKDGGVAEVATIDFAGETDPLTHLTGRGILVQEEDGDYVCYWFAVDGTGANPGEGNSQVQVDISS